MFSMGQAATEAGISKSTLSRAIKIGRVSATRNDQGGYSIDPAELFRVYPRNDATGSTRPGKGQMKQDATPVPAPDATPALRAEIDGLRVQLAMMREHADKLADELTAQRDDMKEQRDELKAQRDSWQKQAEASQRQLADQRQPRRGLFGFLKAG